MPLLTVGTKAPDFSAKDEQNQALTSSQAMGSAGMVLIFYPGDMTPGCTVQLCAIRDDWAKFESAGVKVYGVNHADAASHITFRGTYKFPFPLLIDEDKAMSRAFGATRSFLGLSLLKRTVVGIDNQGMIVFYRHGMPKNADILKVFTKNLKNV